MREAVPPQLTATGIAKPGAGVASATSASSPFYNWDDDDWRMPGTGDVAAAEIAARERAASADTNGDQLALITAAAGEVHRSIAAFLEVVESLPPELAARFSAGQAVPLALAALRTDDEFDHFDEDGDGVELAGMLAADGGR